MSQSGEPLAVVAKVEFELEKLESYTVAQLKQFCKEFYSPIKSSTKKYELQKALKAWLAAKKVDWHTAEDNMAVEEVVKSIHGDVGDNMDLPGGRASKEGSSVSSKGLTQEKLEDTGEESGGTSWR
ncbi:hypothetical protein NDU88_007616 [Pleurodeles waltl]|uniref:Uncharacterized protein n=1 Tax=Pleurodeles waltl TaxID=8319 RepID=A0AAV7N3Y4_PLEWA|nr:hypothetical protein NDU88_007616 [Pleurodeles waltl]